MEERCDVYSHSNISNQTENRKNNDTNAIDLKENSNSSILISRFKKIVSTTPTTKDSDHYNHHHIDSKLIMKENGTHSYNKKSINENIMEIK